MSELTTEVEQDGHLPKETRSECEQTSKQDEAGIHLHCMDCFDLRCTASHCPIVKCKHKCEQMLHTCKQSEHSLICRLATSACLNRYYGCPFVGTRSSILEHLQHCPASAVQCGMAWNRTPLYSKTRANSVPFLQYNPATSLDDIPVRLAQYDQERLDERYRQRITKGRVTISKLDKQSCIDPSRMETLQTLLRGEKTPDGADKQDQNAPSSETEHRMQEPDLALENLTGNTSTDCCETKSNTHLLLPPVRLGLSIVIETLPKFQRKLPSYRFECERVLRRDQYSYHFQNVHGDIHGHIEGWIVRRCPLAQYGCSYSASRMYPNDLESRVIYSRLNNSVGLSSCQSTEHVNGQTFSFCSLPDEVIESIFLYLDNYTLWNIALVCKKFRSICEGLVIKRGVVELKWQRRTYGDVGMSWQIKSRIWHFTSSFSPIRKWVWKDPQQESFGKHIERCRFAERQLRTDAIKLPGLDKKVHQTLEDTTQ